jgi:AraC family transcriptional activator of tynA and feaB
VPNVDEPKVSSRSVVEVWDTANVPPSQAFDFFCEGVRNSFLPWSQENRSRAFRARLESVRFENGLIGRIRSTPTEAFRTSVEIADSKVECVYASLQLFGDACIRQGENIVIARPGDLTIFDSTTPTTHTALGPSDTDAIALLVPKSALREGVRSLSSPFPIPSIKLIEPLASCLQFLTQHLHDSAREELNALFDACLDLLPVAASYRELPHSFYRASSNRLLQAIFVFIDETLHDLDLSARRVGLEFNISERYVHKLFSTLGITFSYYVRRRRLDHVRADLLDPALRRTPIAVLAYRWGFNDISTFNRAFKKTFGYSPRRMRH